MKSNEVCLSNILEPGKNNFNLIQLALAYLVVWNHSCAISPADGSFGSPILSGIEVPSFAFLLALLYSNSLDKNGSLLRGLIRPFFRLYMNFVFAILFAAIIIAPFLFVDTPLDYFSNLSTPLHYIRNNLLLNLQFEIPNTLVKARNNYGINGAIWMVPLFLGYYLWIASWFSFSLPQRVLQRTTIVTIFAFLLLFHLKKDFLPNLTKFNDFAFITTLSFLIGCLVYVYKDKIILTTKKIFGIFFLFIIFKDTQLHDIVRILFVLGLLLYVGKSQIIQTIYRPTPAFKFIKLKISMGIFLYSFPIQQTIAYYFPKSGPAWNFAFSSILVTLVAILSSLTIERKLYSLADRTFEVLNKFLLTLVNSKQ